MDIKDIEKCLINDERIDADAWFETKGYRNASSTLFWEYQHSLVFSGNYVQTNWNNDPLAQDYVQAAIFTNVKGFENFEFIVIARIKKNEYNQTTASMFLYTNAPTQKPVRYISPYGEKHSIFCYHQIIYLDYKNLRRIKNETL